MPADLRISPGSLSLSSCPKHDLRHAEAKQPNFDVKPRGDYPGRNAAVLSDEWLVIF